MRQFINPTWANARKSLKTNASNRASRLGLTARDLRSRCHSIETLEPRVHLSTGSPSTNGLLLWLDSSNTASVVTNAFGNVTSWANLAPGATNAVTYSGTDDNDTTGFNTNAPTYATGPNGVKVVNFGGNGYLDNLSFSTAMPTALTVFMIASVFANPGGYSAFMAFSASQSQNDYQTGLNVDMGANPTATFSDLNVEGAEAGGTGGFELLSTPTTFNAFHTFQINEGTTVSDSVDGTFESSIGGASNPIALNDLYIGTRATDSGGDQAANHDLQGQIAAMLVYSGTLSGTDLTQTQSYLANFFAGSQPVKSIGALDPTFGTNGLASHNVGFTSTAGVVLDSSGDSLIAGTIGSGSSQQFGLTRYNPDGTLDTTFGTNGVVASSFGGSDQASAVAYLPATGDILVAGTDTVSSGSQFALAEYTSAGVLDTTFGNGAGFVLTSFSNTLGTLSNDTARALAVSANGSTIDVAGSSDAAGTGLDFAVASYSADGSANTRFGGTGTTLLDFSGGDDAINAIAFQANGDLVAAGYTTNPTTGIASIALARFLPTASVDPHFGTKGKVVTNVRDVADVASAIAIDKTGKIVIGGLSATGSASDDSLSSDFVVARYTAAGAIDRTFGGGPVITSFGQPSAVSQVLIQSNGEIIASGKTVGSLDGLDPTQLEVAVARYTTTGKLDTSFNMTGTAVFNLSGNPQAAQAARPGFLLASFSVPFALSPADTADALLSEFNEFEQSSQGVIATTQGGELLDVGNSGMNTVEAAIVTAGIDLAAALIAKLPAAALEGARGSLSVKITENGTDPATGTVTLQLYVSPDAIVDSGATPFQSIPEKINLKQNQSRTIPLKYALPGTAGDFYLVANINTGSVADLNPNNNVAASSSPIQVAAPFVDLAGSALASAGTLGAGLPATITFTVANDGNILARSAPVEILASPDGTVEDGTEIVEPTLLLNLPANTTRNYRLSFKIPSTLETNTYVIVADLDPDNTLSDPNLANNVIVGQTEFIIG